jgi:hypothetical protein
MDLGGRVMAGTEVQGEGNREEGEGRREQGTETVTSMLKRIERIC